MFTERNSPIEQCNGKRAEHKLLLSNPMTPPTTGTRSLHLYPASQEFYFGLQDVYGLLSLRRGGAGVGLF